jgi:hypothetical protein
MNPDTIKLIIEFCAAVGRQLVEAFQQDDAEPIRRLGDVVGDPLRSRLTLQHQEEVTRRKLGGG